MPLAPPEFGNFPRHAPTPYPWPRTASVRPVIRPAARALRRPDAVLGNRNALA